MFTDHKISAFQQRVSDLPDTPTLSASELKARFDACPEELRQALNGVCDDGKALEDRMDAYRAQTFTGEIEREMLSADVQEELSAKADQTDLDIEIQAREQTDMEVSKKCEILAGTYTGDGADTHIVELGFQPSALLVMEHGYLWNYGNGEAHGAFAYPGQPSRYMGNNYYEPALEILDNGFRVTNSERTQMNASGNVYAYLAFRA